MLMAREVGLEDGGGMDGSIRARRCFIEEGTSGKGEGIGCDYDATTKD